MVSIGEKIKEARIRSGLTQEQLAAFLNTSKAAVSRYEADKRKPNIEQLRKIAIATNITVSDLVEELSESYWKSVPKYELEAAFSPNPNQKILCGLFEQLNEVGQQKAIERLEELVEVAKYRKQV